jgi:hypothetical protein
MPSARAGYYRRQADLCVRLSLAASQDDKTSSQLIALAHRYKTRADAIEREEEAAATVPKAPHGQEKA